MCFSATASFITAGALATSGAVIARTQKPRRAIPLSLFPVFFAVLQVAEGLLWLNHREFIGEVWKMPAVYVYLFIAYVLWPLYVPFSAYLLEPDRKRKIIVLLCQIIGLVVGITNLVALVRGPVDAWVVGHSFAYLIDMPGVLAAPYVIAVSIPFLVSSSRRLFIFGIALAVLFGIAAITAVSGTFPSVWCFYASILSVFLCLLFRHWREKKLSAVSPGVLEEKPAPGG